MSKLLTWALTALGNSSSSPDGFPEGMPPSSVNNSAREVMAAAATFADQLQGFINVGIAAVSSSNNLVVSLKTAAGTDPSTTDPLSIIFRSTTLTSGVSVSVDYSAATSVTLPASGTLGAANGETIDAYIWAVYDGTNKDIGISRTINHDEASLYSTTTIGTGSDAANIIYTTTGRTNAAVKLIGKLTIAHGTAQWNSAPTMISVWQGRTSTPSFPYIQLFSQTQPTTPPSGAAISFVDSTAKILCVRDDAGRVSARSANSSTASQGAGFSSDTYVTDSDVLIPSFGVQAKTQITWRISASKTAAGTATPVFSIRIGAARTTSDTARLQITGPAQSAATDTAVYTIIITVRSVDASTGAIQGTVTNQHDAGATTGFSNTAVHGTSAGFDNSALGGQYIGLSINGGASAAWTITQVQSQASW